MWWLASQPTALNKKDSVPHSGAKLPHRKKNDFSWSCGRSRRTVRGKLPRCSPTKPGVNKLYTYTVQNKNKFFLQFCFKLAIDV